MTRDEFFALPVSARKRLIKEAHKYYTMPDFNGNVDRVENEEVKAYMIMLEQLRIQAEAEEGIFSC